MSLILDGCPLPTELVDIPLSNCPFRFDQILRLAFQQRQTSAPFANVAAIQTLSNWQTLEAASDVTKVTVSPILGSGLVIPRSEALTTGGNDNSTPFGIRKYNGEGSVTATVTLSNVTPATKLALEHYSQYSLQTGAATSMLTLYFFNNNNNAFYQERTTNFLEGVPVYNFRVSSRGTEGLNSDDMVDISFDLMAGWDRYLKVTTPTFDPLTQL